MNTSTGKIATTAVDPASAVARLDHGRQRLHRRPSRRAAAARGLPGARNCAAARGGRLAGRAGRGRRPGRPPGSRQSDSRRGGLRRRGPCRGLDRRAGAVAGAGLAPQRGRHRERAGGGRSGRCGTIRLHQQRGGVRSEPRAGHRGVGRHAAGRPALPGQQDRRGDDWCASPGCPCGDRPAGVHLRAAGRRLDNRRRWRRSSGTG